jgi:TonB family protein
METAIQLVPPPPLDLVRPPPPLPKLPDPARPPPLPRPRPHPALPTPMAYSFGGPPRLQSAPHGIGGRGAIDLAFAPAGRLADQLHDGAWSEDKQIGDDWFNLVAAWWRRHAYYPSEAGMNGEQGIATVKLVVRHDGRVESVRLEDSSGSQWLDMAAVAVFRNANLPPLPSDVTSAVVPLHFTIHYIIID